MTIRESATRLALTLALLVAAGNATAGSWQGLSYSSTVSKGKWTTDFNEASDRAAAENVPLVVIWVSKSCGYCKNFAANLSSRSSWMKSRGYYFVIGIGESGVNATIKNYARNETGKYPYCKVYWKRNLDGNTVSKAFSGRSGSSAMSGSKFSGLVDQYTQAGKYAKTYTLSLTPDTAGCSVTGGGSHKGGSKVTLKVKRMAPGYVFAGWYLSGKELKSQKTSYSYVMPSADVAITAKFILKTKDWAKLSYPIRTYSYDTKEESYVRSVAMTPVVVSASGGSLPSVKFSGLPKGMKYSSGKISGKPSKSGIYTVIGRNKTAGGAVAAQTNTVVVRATGEYVIKVKVDPASVGRGSLSGSGVFKKGKTVTQKAKAKSGNVFSGWWDEAGALRTRASSYKHKVEERDMVLTGRFITKAEDRAAIMLNVNGRQRSETEILTNTVVRGLKLSWPVLWAAASSSKVSASGLPAGLKLTKNDSGATVITGVPTTVSALQTATGLRKPSMVTMKVVTAGNTVAYRLAIVVEPLPAWAVGSFDGFAQLGDGGPVGLATMTVSAKGVISGRFGLCGTNWTFNVTGYSEDNGMKHPLKRMLTLRATAKYGKTAKWPIQVEVTSGFDEDHLSHAYADGFDAGELVLTLRRYVWGDKNIVKPYLPGTYRQVGWLEGVTAKVSASGSVAYSGVLNGQKVSSSASVHMDDDELLYSVFVKPSTATDLGSVYRVDIPACD